MPNLAKIYNDATRGNAGLFTPDIKTIAPEVSPAEDAARFQAKQSWLESTTTQDLVKRLTEEMNNLNAEATDLALSYPQHQNHFQIIHRLVKAAEIRNILNTYVRSND